MESHGFPCLSEAELCSSSRDSMECKPVKRKRAFFSVVPAVDDQLVEASACFFLDEYEDHCGNGRTNTNNYCIIQNGDYITEEKQLSYLDQSMSEEEEDNDGGHPSPHLPDDSDNPQDDGKLMVGGRQIFCFSAPNKVNMNDVDNPVAHYAEDMDHHEDDDRSSRGRHVVCPPAPKKLRKSRPAYMGSTLVQKRSFFVPSDLHTLPDFLRALFFP